MQRWLIAFTKVESTNLEADEWAQKERDERETGQRRGCKW